MNRTTLTAVLILIAGVLLRLGMMSSPLIEDERKNIVVARSLSVDGGVLNLPMESEYVTHPLLNIYITKLGITLFGDTVFGARILHGVLGCVALWVVFLLARSWSDGAGCLALLLLACNPFHIHESIRAENSASLYTFASLALWLIWRFMNTKKAVHIVLGAFFMGLAFMTKGDSILLVVAVLLFVLSQGQLNAWFRMKAVCMAAAAFVITISPWLNWVLRHGSAQLMYDPSMYTLDQLRPTWTTLQLYLIQPVYALIGKDYRMYSSWEYAPMDGVSGLLLLTGVVLALFRPKDKLQWLMLTVFAVPMIVLSFFTLPGLLRGEFWWAWLSLIPAVCLTGLGLSKFVEKGRGYQWGVIILGVYLLGHAVVFVAGARERFSAPPFHRAVFVDDDQITARIYEDQGQIDQAIQETLRLLKRAPHNVDNLNYLGWLYWSKADFELAVDVWLRSKELLPEYTAPANKLDVFLDDQIYRYQQRLETDPENIKSHFYLGALLYHAEDVESSLEHFDRVNKGHELHGRAMFYQGLIYRSRQQWSMSQQRFDDSRQVPDYANLSLRYQGINAISQGRWDAALTRLRLALEVNPHDILSRYDLALVHEQLGQTDKSDKIRAQMREMIHSDIRRRINGMLGGRYRNLLTEN